MTTYVLGSLLRPYAERENVHTSWILFCTTTVQIRSIVVSRCYKTCDKTLFSLVVFFLALTSPQNIVCFYYLNLNCMNKTTVGDISARSACITRLGLRPHSRALFMEPIRCVNQTSSAFGLRLMFAYFVIPHIFIKRHSYNLCLNWQTFREKKVRSTVHEYVKLQGCLSFNFLSIIFCWMSSLSIILAAIGR